MNCIISIDTIRAFINIRLCPKDLLKNGWKSWKSSDKDEQFIIQIGNFFFKYLPTYRYLCVQFSASKVINSSNAKPFIFKDTNRIINIVNSTISKVLPLSLTGEPMPDFSFWTVNRLDIFSDYNVGNIKNKLLYLKAISRLNYSRCKNTVYNTSNYATSKSYNYNIYSKSDEMMSKKNSSNTLYKGTNSDNTANHSNKSAGGFDNLNDYLICRQYENNIRLEIQLKKNALVYRLGNKRTVQDVFNVSICKRLFIEYLKKVNLDLQILQKEELFKIIEKSYSTVVAANIIKFITEFNETDRKLFISKYKKSTIYNYLNRVRKLGISPVYIDQKSYTYVNFLALVNVKKVSNNRFVITDYTLKPALFDHVSTRHKSYIFHFDFIIYFDDG